MRKGLARSAALTSVLLLGLLAPGLAPAGTPRHHPRGGPVFDEYLLTLRLGQFEPDGQSDLWHENFDLYRLSTEGIEDWVVGLDFGTSVGNRTEVLFGLEYYSGEDTSSRFVDFDGVPIVLTNRLRLAPVTVSLKLLPFGRRDGVRYRRLVPYVGGGVGVYLWDYEEVGDFIDPVTDEVFSGRAEADGSAFGTHLFAGLEVPFSPYWSLLIEGRRHFVDDDLGGLFQGFDEFDLSGDSLTVGASFRF